VTCKTITVTVTKTVHGKRKKVKVKKQRCTTKTVTGPVKFTTSVARAVLSRGRVTYATGIATINTKHPQLALTTTHKLRAGTYTLTLRWSTKHTNHTTRQHITLR
jgi:hypothetical protein